MKYGDGIFQEGIESQLDEKFVKRPHPVFFEMETLAKEKNLPIVSASTGNFLKLLVELYKPQSILELGTNIGYSLLWMFFGLSSKEGQKDSNLLTDSLENKESFKILSVDRNPYEHKIGQNYLQPYLPLGWEIQFHSGWILDSLEKKEIHPENFELVFVDCDKINYPRLWEVYKESLGKRVGKRTLWIFDNVLWKGRILREDHPNKPSDQAVLKFWENVRTDSQNFTLVPIGDGLCILGNWDSSS